ncbi:MAG TPA: carboxypeptidase-like regulatory domain-containing protein [Thermoanaerobaculia bacterium]
MRRFRAFAVAVLVVIAIPAHSNTPLPTVLQVLGHVTNAARPVGNALVIALNLQDFEAIQTYTGTDGSFSLPKLRGGVYKIIAVKQGFLPAIATIAPTRPSHRVALKLETEKQARGRDATQEIWELRGSLPKDVLRDLDAMMMSTEVASYELPRIKGEMVSMTGVATQPANPAFAQTALGVQGRIGDTWQVGIRGNLQRFEDPTDEVRFGRPLAESRVMSMELRSSPNDSVRVASTRSSWLYVEPDAAGDRQADVSAHNIEWTHGGSRVQVRYFEQDNLFQSSPEASSLVEVAGNTPVFQSRRTDLGVSLRVRQESVESTANPLHTADLSANGNFSVVPSLVVHYGVASRLRMEGQEWASRTGAEWKMTERTSLIASGLYKVVDRDASLISTPSIVFWADDSVLPRYSYSFGIVSGKDGKNRLTAIATVTAIDAPQRLVFGDGYDHFWDGLSVDAGDIRRDVRVAYRREFGNKLAVDVATTAGTATNDDESLEGRTKVYVTGDLQSTFTPTRTTLAVSYREIQQPRDDGADYRTERVNVRMAQSLYLPIDIKLLLGLELARAENSPFLLDTLTVDETSRKYIGGLALNF